MKMHPGKANNSINRTRKKLRFLGSLRAACSGAGYVKRYASKGNAMLTKTIFPLLLAFSVPSFAAVIEFEGTPEVKVQVMDGSAQTESVPPKKAREFRVVVVRDGDQFYWASRNNVPLTKRESGAYITYVAANGAGYVRVLIPAMRSTLQDQRTREFVYMEHMVNQMGSITYYGK